MPDNLINRREFSSAVFACLAFSGCVRPQYNSHSSNPPAVSNEPSDTDQVSSIEVERKVAYYPPQALGDLMAIHIRKIIDAGYATELSQEDLYHGHLIWKRNSDNDLLRLDRDIYSYMSGGATSDPYGPLAMILYHSAESGERWEIAEQYLPIDKRTPRSIVGFLDGSIVPAIELLKVEIDTGRFILPDDYTLYGSIREIDLAQANPNLFAAGAYLLSIGPQLEFVLHSEGRHSFSGNKLAVYSLDQLKHIPIDRIKTE